MTLYEYAQEIYNNVGGELSSGAQRLIRETAFEEIIHNDDKCLELIREVLEFNVSSSVSNANRASHILVTWLLGIGFGSHLMIDVFPGHFDKKEETKLWLQTAMIHDYGYFCDELGKRDLAFNELVGNYNLLDDVYEYSFLQCLNDIRFWPDFEGFFTYSRQEIENYFAYSVDLHRNEEEPTNHERADHGIVGGCLAFKNFCKRLEKNSNVSDEMIKIQKVACYTAASHNIFKSNSADTDIIYLKYGLDNLLSTSPIRITNSNMLLLLLSLVDTVECTKRFSKKENLNAYLQQDTTLKRVKMELGKKEITLDFSDLYNYIIRQKKKPEMAAKLERHVDAIIGLPSWTAFSTEEIDNLMVSISI